MTSENVSESGNAHRTLSLRIQFNEENHPSTTSREQIKVEKSVEKLFVDYLRHAEINDELPLLNRKGSADLAYRGLSYLSQSYECLDASRAWVCYWNLHSLKLLDEPISEELAEAVQIFLSKCQYAEGGFGGGPYQFAHLAPTYAAVNALVTVGTEEAYKIINRSQLKSFLKKCRNSEGAFALHVGGEVDVRGTYCALAVAKLTNIFDDDLFQGTAEWILKCQTYEGGFGGCPGMEAHGGYTFCALASLVLLERAHHCNIRALLRWTAHRQMRYEGGFQGRTNKLVDGCYSFWQGAVFPLLHHVLATEDRYSESLSLERWLFHQEGLQQYLLICCQHHLGGLLDKPGKPRDFYHTCYGLSGLSIAQHYGNKQFSSTIVEGSPKNELVRVNPVYNVEVGAVSDALSYFESLPSV